MSLGQWVYEVVLNRIPLGSLLIKVYFQLKRILDRSVNSNIEDKIELVEKRLGLSMGNVPYYTLVLTFRNNNLSEIEIDAFDISLMFDNRGATFERFFWDKESISEPSGNILVDSIEPQSDGGMRISTMLPYYAYFPNDDNRLVGDSTSVNVRGRVRFSTVAGHIEYDLKTVVQIEHDELRNSSAQSDLEERFSL